MPNIKSQKKRVLTNEKSRLRNQDIKSRLKTYMKQADEALSGSDKAAAESAVSAAVSEIDRAKRKGTIHANSAARKKSSLARRINAFK